MPNNPFACSVLRAGTRHTKHPPATATPVPKEDSDPGPMKALNLILLTVQSALTAPLVFHNKKKENNFACRACLEK
jgi:hypothetical protein